MQLNWQRIDVTTISDNGISRKNPTDFGTDETGRIFGEVRDESPVFIALHLRKPVGRYLNAESAKAAIQLVHDIVTAPTAD